MSLRKFKTGQALTEREKEVLIKIADGYSSKEIASFLDLGKRTTDDHRKHIMTKTGIHTIAGLTKYAITHGLTDMHHKDSPR